MTGRVGNWTSSRPYGRRAVGQRGRTAYDEEDFGYPERSMPVDPAELTKSLRRLAERNDPGELMSSLREVADACVSIFDVAGSGIMIADDQNITRYVAATDGPGRILEIAESETGSGPCTEAFVTNQSVAVTDLPTDPRWPELAALVTGRGVHAILGSPVRLGGITVGTLDVYRDHPHEWDEGERAALARFGDLVGTMMMTALAAHHAQEVAEQLQYALDYRVIIERGVGYLMSRDRIDPVTAFDRLRRSARNTQSRIGDVASRLLESGRLPNDPGSGD